jgi:predicted nucleic acid-binding protein
VILVDTSVWVDHLRGADRALSALLDQGRVLMHPFVVGEIACGSLRARSAVLGLLRDLPSVPVAEDDEVLRFIEARALHGQGIGYVDAHLLAAVALTGSAKLWTRDKRLQALAGRSSLAFDPAAA